MSDKKYKCIGYWTEFDINKFQDYIYYLIWYEYENSFDIVYARHDPALNKWITQDNRVSISSSSIKFISIVQ